MKWLGLLRHATLAQPQALYLLIGVLLITGWALLHAERPRQVIAPLLRGLLLAVLVLALAGPQRSSSETGSARSAAVDVSQSITPAMRQWTRDLLHSQLALRADDSAVAFGAAPVETTIGALDGLLDGKQHCAACNPTATNLEAALRKLPAGSGAEANRSLVLVTDGWENAGDASTALAGVRAAGVSLMIFTPPATTKVANVALTRLDLPHALSSVEPFKLGVTLFNMNDAVAPGTLQVTENGKQVAEQQISAAPGEQRVDFPIRTETTGLLSYKVTFRPTNPDQDLYKEDDILEGWIGIGARRKVLILTGRARDASYLKSVVQKLGLEPEIRDLSENKFTGAISGVDAVLLNNVARNQFAPGAEEALVNYAQRGGALAVIGGDQSFGLGGYVGSQLEKALPVTAKPPVHKQQQRALVLIIDKSLSMGRENKLVYAKAAARTASKALTDDDLLSVVGFDAQPFVVVPLQPLSQSRPYLNDMIDRLKARGTTYLIPALKEAERDLAGSGAAIKHVVILTDGETGGTAAMYYDLVSSMHREGGVTISTIAIGREPNIRLLESISKYGGGAFYHTASAENLPELFLQDVRSHSGEQTVVEKEFTPLSRSPNPVLKDFAGRKLPAIKGYVGTALKPSASLDMYVEREGRQEPLIASWRYGSGRTLAVTTDASGRWSSEWIRGDVFGALWDRLLTWLSPQSPSGPQFDVAMGYRDGRLHLKLIDYQVNSHGAETLMRASVRGPEGGVEQLVLSQDAPGELSASFNAPKPGTYRLDVHSAAEKGFKLPPLAYTVSPAVNAELPRPAPNYDLLEQLATGSGGRLNPDISAVSVSRPMIERTESLLPPLLVAAMLLLITEALVRRLTY